LESEQNKSEGRTYTKALPVKDAKTKVQDVSLKQFDDLYGFRGQNENVYWLSPWEFLMLWECLRLPKPPATRVISPSCTESDTSDSSSDDEKKYV